MLTIVPIQIAEAIPWYPVIPEALRIPVEISSVAIIIPDIGLLEEPTIPTIRLETVAKKKPKTTIKSPPTKFTGMEGRIHMIKAMTRLPARTTCIGKSLSVLRVVFPVLPFPSPFIALENVFIIIGRDLTRLIIPPAATAPAPMYLI